MLRDLFHLESILPDIQLTLISFFYISRLYLIQVLRYVVNSMVGVTIKVFIFF